MELVSVLGIYNYAKLEAEYMRTGDKWPVLEHCFGMWKMLGDGRKDDSVMNGFLRQQISGITWDKLSSCYGCKIKIFFSGVKTIEV